MPRDIIHYIYGCPCRRPVTFAPCPLLTYSAAWISSSMRSISVGDTATDGHSGPDEDFEIERVSNCGLVDFDCFSDRLLRSSIEPCACAPGERPGSRRCQSEVR